MRIIFSLLLCGSTIVAQTDPIQSTLIFLSDTQTPMWAEKLYLSSNDNEAATQNIFSSILKENNLAAVIHAGDITGHGWLRSSWKPILPFIDSLKSRTIPFLAAKGNHDYYFISSWAMDRFEEYIPNGKSDYSIQRFGNGAVVILNSNADKLDDDILANQRQWYDSTLSQCDSDTSVQWVITVAHHSPFTNSDMVTGSEFIRGEYLAAFYKSVKSKVWIGGHAHRFEHFRKNEKDFLVIGGGGGLHHGKRTENPYDDLHKNDGRFFHYLRCTVLSDSLSFEVVDIPPDSPESKIGYRFSIPLP
ncbi:MAG: metallophosphoesterase [Ignavibacteriales bacterium]|nr:metallophosphoesterase [Ignavibacteriales bacterium]